MSILVWYFVLFAPQLVIGAAIGWWVAHRRGNELAPARDSADEQATDEPSSDVQTSDESASREQELRLALSQLKTLTDGVQEVVREHAEKVDFSSKELAALESDDASGALAAIGPIVKANEELQQRLQETEQKLAEQAEQLDQQTTEARTDTLTKLLNRRGMECELSKLLDAYEQSETSFCFTILDIDHFKKFNDTYGHDVGDVVLSEIARVISGAVSRQDIVARFGGEEFVILSPDTELHEAGQLLERVRTAVEANVVRAAAGGELKVTISLGVAQISAENSAALLKRADTALYAAKEAGRNRAYFHDGLHTHPVSLGDLSSANDGRSDVLTDLPNRAAFAEELGRRIAESTRTESDVSLVILEIDQLAVITEEHGDETADLVRRGVAAFLTGIMRDMDLVARHSENSFCMLLPACSLDDANQAAERVRIAASKTPFQIGDIELQLTLSAGVTLAAREEPSDSLMQRAEKALEVSLNSGGDRTSVEQPPAEAADAEVDAEVEMEVEMEVDAADADTASDAGEESLEPTEEALAVS